MNQMDLPTQTTHGLPNPLHPAATLTASWIGRLARVGRLLHLHILEALSNKQQLGAQNMVEPLFGNK